LTARGEAIDPIDSWPDADRAERGSDGDRSGPAEHGGRAAADFLAGSRQPRAPGDRR